MFYLSLVSLSILFCSVHAMEQDQEKLLTLKELAARQVAPVYGSKLQKLPDFLPEDCKIEIARQLLLSKKFQEVKPIAQGDLALYLLKENYLVKETPYIENNPQKPTKCLTNPFERGNSHDEVKFVYDYSRVEPPFPKPQHFYHSGEKIRYLMHSFLGPKRLCAGPNKNEMLIVSDASCIYIAELEHKPKEKFVICEKIYPETETLKQDHITALEVSPYENIFYGGTKSGKVYYYDRIIIDEAWDRYGWGRFELPAAWQKAAIDDLRLGNTGEFLYLLSDNALIAHNRITQTNELLFRVNLPSMVLEGVEQEKMNVFVISPDCNYALIGGTKGTILLADLETKRSYLLEEEADSGIYQLWWTDQEVQRPVVALRDDGMAIALKLSIAKAEQYFN